MLVLYVPKGETFLDWVGRRAKGLLPTQWDFFNRTWEESLKTNLKSLKIFSEVKQDTGIDVGGLIDSEDSLRSEQIASLN